MSSHLLYEVREVFVQCAFLGLLVLATEAGFRFGVRTAAKAERVDSQISSVEAGILAVLGLLLGFTMSMAVTRYETRKHLVLEEANALGTSCLRAELLPEPGRKELLDLLHQYIRDRVAYGEGRNDPEGNAALRGRTALLQQQFWSKAVSFARESPNPVTNGLLLQSLNESIDLEAARWMSLNDHVPDAVIYVIALVGLLAASLVGYSFGIRGRRQRYAVWALSIAITIVLSVIVDLDRPRTGFIRVSQQPMIDLLRSSSGSSAPLR